MAGTKAGGLKAAITNKKEHGEDFYARLGAKGGRNGHTGGFASNKELAIIAGAKGGAKSRRGETNRIKEIEAKKSEVVALLDMGVSKREVARRIGVNYSSFVYWVRTRLG